MPTSLLERIRNDLQLAVISVVALLAVATILPFGIYRLLNGQWVIAAVDGLIVVSIGWAMSRAWRGGSLEAAGLIMAMVTTASCMLVSILFARHGLLWAYVVFTTNFVLTGRRYALLANLALLLVLALHPAVFEQAQERVVFIATSVLVSSMAFIFAYHTASQRQQLVALASRDVLTGVRNRLAMQTDLTLAVQTHRHSDTPCGIAMLDLDHFKRVNDDFGHEEGDRVLVEFARVAEASCRKRDRLYRLGGEEFVMLLPNTPADGLRAALEHLRGAVERSLKAPDGRPVTVSAGAALLRGENEWADWLARADAALYRAKGRGRNRVVMDGDPVGDGEADQLERRRRPT
jgi:diguanylate cyclase (GGDEF)-like protein